VACSLLTIASDSCEASMVTSTYSGMQIFRFGATSDGPLWQPTLPPRRFRARSPKMGIATWNDNPRPFTWTKTADGILKSLADYLARVGTGHRTGKQD
jgi:hypothetical protein